MKNGERITVYAPKGMRVRLPNLTVVKGEEGAAVIVDRWVRARIKAGDLFLVPGKERVAEHVVVNPPRDETAALQGRGRGKHVERFAAQEGES